MKSTTATARNARPFWARLGALVCLLAWFAGTPSLLPEMVAALGGLDAQHRVEFAQCDGRVSVIFHHESGAQAPAHLHSPLAKMLTVLAQSNPTQDHVLTFAQTNAASVREAFALPVATIADLPPLAENFAPLPLPQTAAAPMRVARPPPTCAFALVCLRSSTLLI